MRKVILFVALALVIVGVACGNILLSDDCHHSELRAKEKNHYWGLAVTGDDYGSLVHGVYICQDCRCELIIATATIKKAESVDITEQKIKTGQTWKRKFTGNEHIVLEVGSKYVVYGYKNGSCKIPDTQTRERFLEKFVLVEPQVEMIFTEIY